MKKLVLFILPILIGFNLINLSAQSKEKDIPLNLGGYLGLNYNMHNGDFQYPTSFNASSNNPVPIGFYGAESSLGLNGGFIINVPFDNMFIFSGRLGLHGAGADFATTSDKYTHFLTDTSTYFDEFESSLMYGEIDLFMQFHNVIPVDNLYLLAGLELGIPITASYNRLETRITTDEFGISTSTDLPSSGDIMDTPLRLALALGAGYMMEIDDNIFLTPEVSFRLPFSNVSDFNGGTNNDWNLA
jgi:hypothetical protein